MEKLKKILRDNFPSIDFEKEKHLTSDDLLDSLDILTVISLLKQHFGVNLSIEDMDPKNFESVEEINSLVKRLK